MPPDDMRDRRGRDLAMIFQDPLSSLNPVVPIGIQVTEVLERHRGHERRRQARGGPRTARRGRHPGPDRRLKEYPHQMSGGMRQRALIAMALACKPRLLIADEPTTALDVTIQAQILELLKQLVDETGTALIMITHDLGVVAGLCDTVNVLYGGRVVESAPPAELFAAPRHPYTERAARLDPPAGLAARRAAARRSPARCATRCRGRGVRLRPRCDNVASTPACRRRPTCLDRTSPTGPPACGASTRCDNGRLSASERGGPA